MNDKEQCLSHNTETKHCDQNINEIYDDCWACCDSLLYVFLITVGKISSIMGGL